MDRTVFLLHRFGRFGLWNDIGGGMDSYGFGGFHFGSVRSLVGLDW